MELPAGGLPGRDPYGHQEAQRAETALVAEGFAPRDVKLYTGNQILANHEKYMGRRGVTSKVVGSVADDQEGRKLYLEYAPEDQCALWLRLPDENPVSKALRMLADVNYLNTRYYGSGKQQDFASRALARGSSLPTNSARLLS